MFEIFYAALEGNMRPINVFILYRVIFILDKDLVYKDRSMDFTTAHTINNWPSNLL